MAIKYPIHLSHGVIFRGRIYIPNEQLIQCLICGKYFRSFATHLKRIHEITEREYKKEFNCFLSKGIVCPSTLEKLKAIKLSPEQRKRAIEKLKSYPRNLIPKQEFNPISRIPSRIALKQKTLKRKYELLKLGQNLFNEKQRRLRKKDFKPAIYRYIFFCFGSFSNFLKELNINLPLERPWLRKPIKEIKKRKKEYQREWDKKNRDKKREYSRRAMAKYKLTKEGRAKLRKYARKSYQKLKNAKKCPTCEKLIYFYSSHCHSCTNRLRMKLKFSKPQNLEKPELTGIM